jgi:hypothetical protein
MLLGLCQRRLLIPDTEQRPPRALGRLGGIRNSVQSVSEAGKSALAAGVGQAGLSRENHPEIRRISKGSGITLKPKRGA